MLPEIQDPPEYESEPEAVPAANRSDVIPRRTIAPPPQPPPIVYPHGAIGNYGDGDFKLHINASREAWPASVLFVTEEDAIRMATAIGLKSWDGHAFALPASSTTAGAPLAHQAGKCPILFPPRSYWAYLTRTRLQLWYHETKIVEGRPDDIQYCVDAFHALGIVFPVAEHRDYVRPRDPRE